MLNLKELHLSLYFLSCSFLLTAEEKEPKKTATSKPLHRGFN
jgi:hypothetical protein